MHALRTVQKFRDQWEETERKNLECDIQRKISALEHDKQYKEAHEPLDLAELEMRAEQANQPKEGETWTEEQRLTNLKRTKHMLLTKTFYDPEGMISHAKQLERDKLRASAEASRAQTPEGEPVPVETKYYPMAPEQWKSGVTELKKHVVLKFSRVVQTLFYLLGYSREEICERDTNRLCLKKAREQINEKLFAKMGNWSPIG